MKTTLQKTLAVVALATSLTLVSCGGEPAPTPSEKPSETTTQVPSESTTEEVPESTSNPESWWLDGKFRDYEGDGVLVTPEEVTLEDNDYHTDIQKAYIQSTWNRYFDLDMYGKKEQSKPRGIKVNLTRPTDTYVQLSESQDFKDAFVYKLDDASQPFVKNLKGNTKYYYRSGASAEAFEGACSEVTTANLFPRNIDVDGVTNVRDLGGYTSKLGGTIRQGMYYRGGRLAKEDGEGIAKCVSPAGELTLTETLGIKTEVDLRNGVEEAGNMNNEVFPTIEYVSIPMNTYGIDNIMLEFKPEIKRFFDLASDVNNYPIYVHCKIGTDRTGLISYLMGALLGLDTEALLTDYLYSNLGRIGSGRSEFVIEDNYYNVLKDTYRQPTLQLCVEAFLKDIGVSQENIESIKNIMIEK